MKIRRIVQFYGKPNGTKSVGEWLDGLDDARAQAVAMEIKFFEAYPNLVVPTTFFEKVRGAISEIKAHDGSSDSTDSRTTPGWLARLGSRRLGERPGKQTSIFLQNAGTTLCTKEEKAGILILKIRNLN